MADNEKITDSEKDPNVSTRDALQAGACIPTPKSSLSVSGPYDTSSDAPVLAKWACDTGLSCSRSFGGCSTMD